MQKCSGSFYDLMLLSCCLNHFYSRVYCETVCYIFCLWTSRGISVETHICISTDLRVFVMYLLSKLLWDSTEELKPSSTNREQATGREVRAAAELMAAGGGWSVLIRVSGRDWFSLSFCFCSLVCWLSDSDLYQQFQVVSGSTEHVTYADCQQPQSVFIPLTEASCRSGS